MNAFARIDKAAFGAFIQRQTEGRYEFVRGLIVQQMTGGTRVHGLVARRMTRSIEDQIASNPAAVASPGEDEGHHSLHDQARRQHSPSIDAIDELPRRDRKQQRGNTSNTKHYPPLHIEHIKIK